MLRTHSSQPSYIVEKSSFSKYELTESLNPWWTGEKDRTVASWKTLRYRVRLRWISRLSLKPFSLNFVVGPRLVGKTTGIKLLINELSSENPFSVLYLNCEIFSSFRDLLQALRWYLDFKGKEGGRKILHLPG